jgi:hypothetical protein
MPPAVSRRAEIPVSTDEMQWKRRIVVVLRLVRFLSEFPGTQKGPFIQLGRRGLVRAARGSTHLSRLSLLLLERRARSLTAANGACRDFLLLRTEGWWSDKLAPSQVKFRKSSWRVVFAEW